MVLSYLIAIVQVVIANLSFVMRVDAQNFRFFQFGDFTSWLMFLLYDENHRNKKNKANIWSSVFLKNFGKLTISTQTHEIWTCLEFCAFTWKKILKKMSAKKVSTPISIPTVALSFGSGYRNLATRDLKKIIIILFYRFSTLFHFKNITRGNIMFHFTFEICTFLESLPF